MRVAHVHGRADHVRVPAVHMHGGVAVVASRSREHHQHQQTVERTRRCYHGTRAGRGRSARRILEPRPAVEKT
jgi:hypothetical protein